LSENTTGKHPLADTGGPSLRTVAMPADTNPSGDIFGGWLLSQMDIAGGNAAGLRAKGRVTAVSVEAMTFHKPVLIGDEVSCYTTILRVGRTSIRVKIDTWVRRGFRSDLFKVTEGIFTYVAIGDDRRPRPVPQD